MLNGERPPPQRTSLLRTLLASPAMVVFPAAMLMNKEEEQKEIYPQTSKEVPVNGTAPKTGMVVRRIASPEGHGDHDEEAGQAEGDVGEVGPGEHVEILARPVRPLGHVGVQRFGTRHIIGHVERIPLLDQDGSPALDGIVDTVGAGGLQHARETEDVTQ